MGAQDEALKILEAPATAAEEAYGILGVGAPRARTTTEKVAESWRRGDMAVRADSMAAEAILFGTADWDEARRLKADLELLQRLDPVEAEWWGARPLYGAARILPGMLRGFAEAKEEVLTGAAAGASLAAVAGAAGPQVAVPEEVLTVPAGTVIGAKMGLTLGSMEFWWRQGTGEMLHALADRGLDPSKGKWVAAAAAIPYALIEFVQVKALTPGLREGVRATVRRSMARVMFDALKRYGLTLTQETLEEVAQEGVLIAGEEVARYLQGEGVELDAEAFHRYVQRLATVGIEAAKDMAYLPVPGAAVDVAAGVAARPRARPGLSAAQREALAVLGEVVAAVEEEAPARRARAKPAARPPAARPAAAPLREGKVISPKDFLALPADLTPQQQATAVAQFTRGKLGTYPATEAEINAENKIARMEGYAAQAELPEETKAEIATAFEKYRQEAGLAVVRGYEAEREARLYPRPAAKPEAPPTAPKPAPKAAGQRRTAQQLLAEAGLKEGDEVLLEGVYAWPVKGAIAISRQGEVLVDRVVIRPQEVPRLRKVEAAPAAGAAPTLVDRLKAYEAAWRRIYAEAPDTREGVAHIKALAQSGLTADGLRKARVQAGVYNTAKPGLVAVVDAAKAREAGIEVSGRPAARPAVVRKPEAVAELEARITSLDRRMEGLSPRTKKYRTLKRERERLQMELESERFKMAAGPPTTAAARIEAAAERAAAEREAKAEAKIAAAKEPVKPVPAKRGDTTQIISAGGRETTPAQWALMELDDLKASHRHRAGEFVAREDYPEALQPRDYQQPAERDKVLRYAAEKKAALYVTDNPEAAGGAPSVAADGTVINGSGRVLSLQVAAERGSFRWYVSALMKKAASFGLSPDDVAAMDKPVLVRIVDMHPRSAEAARFAAAGNIPSIVQQTPIREAAQLARLIDDRVLEQWDKYLEKDPEATFSQLVTHPSRGRQIRDRFFKQFPESIRGRYFTADRQLTSEGRLFVEHMLFAKVFEPEVIELMPASWRNAFQAAIAQLLSLRERGGAVNIVPQLAEAVKFAQYALGGDTSEQAFTDYFRQATFLGHESISAGGRMMLSVLRQYGRKSRVLRQKLAAYLKAATPDLEFFGAVAEGPPVDPVQVAAEVFGVRVEEGAAFGAEPDIAQMRRPRPRAVEAEAVEETGRVEPAAIRRAVDQRGVIARSRAGPEGELRAKGEIGDDFMRKFGSNLYSGDLGKIAVKEMLQNALDAIPPEAREAGRVALTVDTRKKTVEVSDSGVGMLPSVVFKELVNPGESAKPTEESIGRYGIATVAVFANADNLKPGDAPSIDYLTQAVLPSGHLTRSHMTGEPKLWLTKGFNVTVEVLIDGKWRTAPAAIADNTKALSRWAEAQGAPGLYERGASDRLPPSPRSTGTSARVRLRPDVEFTAFAVELFVRRARGHMLATKAPWNLDATLDGTVLPAPSPRDSHLPTRHVASVHLPFADADVYVTKRTERTSGLGVAILNRGFYQFTIGVYPPDEVQAPSGIAVDIRPTVTPAERGYPFQPNREALQPNQRAFLESWFLREFVPGLAQAETNLYRQALGKATLIDTPRASRKALRHILLDGTQSLGAELMQQIARLPYVAELTKALKYATAQLQKAAARFEPLFGTAGGYAGVSLGMQNYGLNIARQPMTGEAGPNLLLLNPFAIARDVRALVADGVLPAEDAPRHMAEHTVSTILHELTHNVNREHREAYAGTLTQAIAWTVNVSPVLVRRLEVVYTQALQGSPGFLATEEARTRAGEDIYTVADRIAAEQSGADLFGKIAAGMPAGERPRRGYPGGPRARAERGRGRGESLRGHAAVPARAPTIRRGRAARGVAPAAPTERRRGGERARLRQLRKQQEADLRPRIQAATAEVQQRHRGKYEAPGGKFARRRRQGAIRRMATWGQLSTETQVSLLAGDRGEAYRLLHGNLQAAQRLFMRLQEDAREALLAEFKAAGIDLRTLEEWSEAVSGRAAAEGKTWRRRARVVKVALPKAVDETGERVESLELTPAERIELLLHLDDETTGEEILAGGIVFQRGGAAIAMTEEDLAAVQRSATRQERAAAATMQRLLSGRLWEEFAQVWAAEEGRALKWVERYWPRWRHREFRHLEPGTFWGLPIEEKLSQLGIFKERTGAKAPVVVRDAFFTFFTHVYAMASYTAKARPVREARTLLDDRGFANAVRAATRFGQDRLQDWRDTLKSFQGMERHVDTPTQRATRRFIRRFHIGALGLKAQIILYQTVSLVNGAVEMDAKYILDPRGLTQLATAETRAEIDQASPLLKARIEGSGHQIITPGTAGNAVQAFFGKGEGLLTKIGLGPIHWADTQVILRLWRAAKAEGRAKGLKGNALLRYTARRTEQVVDRTQPTWDPLTISQLAREAKTRPLHKLLVMFSSQRNKNLNMAVRAISGYLHGDISARQMLKGVLIPTVVNATAIYGLQLGVKALVGALAGGDDRERRWHTYLEGWLDRLFGQWIIFGELASFLGVRVPKAALLREADIFVAPRGGPLVGTLTTAGRAGYAAVRLAAALAQGAEPEETRRWAWHAAERLGNLTGPLAGLPTQGPLQVARPHLPTRRKRAAPPGPRFRIRPRRGRGRRPRGFTGPLLPGR